MPSAGASIELNETAEGSLVAGESKNLQLAALVSKMIRGAPDFLGAKKRPTECGMPLSAAKVT
eukprot:9489920-Pyramimonas_sp.AAC.1